MTGIDELGKMLSIWAHPDDESYLAGGVMALASAHGQGVVCVSATAGEHGTSDPVTWPPERLGRLRRWEAAAAMSVLGVDDHRWLGLEDGCLIHADRNAAIDRIASIIDETSPDTILTFGPDGMTFHPDHITIGSWVTEAWRRASRPSRLLYAALEADYYESFRERAVDMGFYMTDQRPTARDASELAVDLNVTGALLDQKVAALSAMHSQIAPTIEFLGPEEFRTMNSRESFVDAD